VTYLPAARNLWTDLAVPRTVEDNSVSVVYAAYANDVGGQPGFPGARKGVTLPLLVISGLATGPPAGVGDGLRFLSPR
jgi:hypothetical protein